MPLSTSSPAFSGRPLPFRITYCIWQPSQQCSTRVWSMDHSSIAVDVHGDLYVVVYLPTLHRPSAVVTQLPRTIIPASHTSWHMAMPLMQGLPSNAPTCEIALQAVRQPPGNPPQLMGWLYGMNWGPGPALGTRRRPEGVFQQTKGDQLSSHYDPDRLISPGVQVRAGHGRFLRQRLVLGASQPPSQNRVLLVVKMGSIPCSHARRAGPN